MAGKSAEIKEAENGYIVHVCNNPDPGSPDSYSEKKFVARDQDEANQIASDGLSGKLKVGKQKKFRGGKSTPPVAAKAATPRKAY